MANIVYLNEFKSRKNRITDIQIAKKYLFSLDPDSLEISLADSIMDLVINYNSTNVEVKFSSLSKTLNVPVSRLKKAYKNLVDHKLLIELSNRYGKPVLVSSKNLILACDIKEYIDSYIN